MKKKELMFILVATFIVVVIWVIAAILHTRPSQPLDSQLQNALQPVTPTFDTKTLDRVNQTKPIPSNVFPLQPTPTPISSPLATPASRPTPSPLVFPSPSASASSSGSISPIFNQAL